MGTFEGRTLSSKLADELRRVFFAVAIGGEVRSCVGRFVFWAVPHAGVRLAPVVGLVVLGGWSG